MKQLILASASPARKEILDRIGIPFVVEVSDYKEDMSLKMPPEELAMHLSKGKAQDVAKKHKNSVVLGADSFVVLNGKLLGKPKDNIQAKEMLSALSGQCHDFITGFTIIDADSGREYSGADTTKVYFRKLSEPEIDSYLSKENVLNRAGAYSIYQLGGALVERVDGDYNNVAGLPLTKIALALRDFGIKII